MARTKRSRRSYGAGEWGEYTRQHDRTAMAMFLRFFGRNRDPATLSQRDWDPFIGARRAGRVGPSGKPVSDRTVEYDLKLLMAVQNWAEMSRDEPGPTASRQEPAKPHVHAPYSSMVED